MIRKAVLLVACMTLAGCTTYGYRGGSGDYYYGSPGTTYRDYGAPYGSIGYGRGYGGYGGWNRDPYGYYGGSYYRPRPVIVRPEHHHPSRHGHHHQHARPESGGRPVHGGSRPIRPGDAHSHRPHRPGIRRPDGPGPGGSRSGLPHRGHADRPGRSGSGLGGHPPRGEGQLHSHPRPRQAAPVSRPSPPRMERAPGPRGERRHTVTTREVQPI